jgi:GMP synthase-like glutamine amidotransferase
MNGPAGHRRVVVFRHVPFEGLGLIEGVLRTRGYAIEYADLYLPGAPVPDTASSDALLFMGGPMSVNDDLAYLRREEETIREAAARGTPVLGICLGAQLIANALGGRVRRNAMKEIGWFEIKRTEAGRSDPLFAGLDPRETVFHWHGETFDLPPGAELLESSERCWNQAFRLKSHIYGLQFHLEVTPAMIADWCRQDANCGDVEELEGPIDPWYLAGRLDVLAQAVFGRWCDMIRSGRSAGA